MRSNGTTIWNDPPERPAVSAVHAAETFTGETAAILDWAVKSCEFKTSDKTRNLVEQLKLKSEARFTDLYMKGFSSKLLTDANASRDATTKLCAEVKDWYGNSGNRIAGLIAPATEPPSPITTKAETGTPERGRRKRNRGVPSSQGQ